MCCRSCSPGQEAVCAARFKLAAKAAPVVFCPGLQTRQSMAVMHTCSRESSAKTGMMHAGHFRPPRCSCTSANLLLRAQESVVSPEDIASFRALDHASTVRAEALFHAMARESAAAHHTRGTKRPM